MHDIQQKTQSMLHYMASRLRQQEIPEHYINQIEQLTERVMQPCEVAVMGEVKAGKSTFINAFLGQDLAMVGNTEMTATLSYFTHKQADAPEAVKCYWRNGRMEYVSRDFVDSLQGHDERTLQYAEKIDYFEYTLDNPLLQQTTLIDTPGTRAVVEKHNEMIGAFMQRQHRLGDDHDKTTRQIGTIATALIYLIKTPKEGDKKFLEEFQQLTGGMSRAFNTIGVLAKIDLDADMLQGRNEQAEKVAAQLKDNLNTVVPVSAGLQWALQALLGEDEAGLERFISVIRRIPTKQLAKLLMSDEFYLDEEISCPVSLEERQQLLQLLPWKDEQTRPWTVFKVIAEVAADVSKDRTRIKQTLSDLAGFERLRAVLQRHFFDRSHLLRAHSVLQSANKVIFDIRCRHLQELIHARRQEKDFIPFIQRNAEKYTEVARDLESFVNNHLLQGDVQKVTKLVEELEQELDTALSQLQQYGEDFSTIQQVSNATHLFTKEEIKELNALLGQYGLDIKDRLSLEQGKQEYVAGRQIYWRSVALRANNATRRQIAQSVATRYAYLLGEINTH